MFFKAAEGVQPRKNPLISTQVLGNHLGQREGRLNGSYSFGLKETVAIPPPPLVVLG